MTQKTVVEVCVSDRDGPVIPFGIMNTEQAQGLPSDYDFTIREYDAEGYSCEADRNPEDSITP